MAKKIGNGLDLLNQRIVNVGDPSGATDGANKQYVDNVARGLKWKDPVRAASTANITVATPGTTLDGVTLAVNDRILLKDQSTASQNGIYVWTASGAALTRTTDADGAGELAPNVTVLVSEGTVNADKAFTISSDAAITIGTTSITFAQVGGGTSYTASNGVVLGGSNFTGVVAPSGGLTVGASGFAIDVSTVSRHVAGNIGNGALTIIAVTHSLGTKDIVPVLRDVATDTAFDTDWVATDINTCTFTFATAPASNAYRFVIMG